MAKKKTKKTKPSKVPSVIHHLVAIKDIAAWGSGAMCGVRAKGGSVKGGSVDHTKVTCKKCARYTNWTVDKYRDACSEPINL